MKSILGTSLVGIILAIIAISFVEASPSPSPLSDLMDVEDRIHVLNHQLDDLIHLYDQTLGCRLFADRISLAPIIQEAK